MSKRHVVCTVDEIPPGSVRIVEVEGRSIGVYNVKGRFYGLRNVCPHQAAPLCKGEITGTNLPSRPGEYIAGRQGEIVRCPWHGWEFDITTGRSFFNPHRVRVKKYDVTVEACPHDASDEDPSVETYRVSVQQDLVVLHL